MRSFAAVATALLALTGAAAMKGAEHPAGLPASEALQRLIEGNDRFIAFRLQHPDQDEHRLKEVSKGQHPFAAVLGCADSRVPPEVVFDQGLGDLFVARVAGNVADDHMIGSLEYAVEHLGVNLIVVLGHQRCGAVSAAVEHGGNAAHIKSLIKSLTPAVKQAEHQAGDKIDNAIVDNVKMTVALLQASRPMLATFVKEGKLKIVGAYYALDSGKVKLVE